MSEQYNLLNERVAPHVLRYSNMTPLAFNAKSSKRIFYTSNQSTYSNSNNVIRIPISSGTSFLDGPNSYVKFTYKNAEAGNVTHKFANSAHNLIYRLRVISDVSGQDLENILYYGFTHSCIADLTLSSAERASKLEQGYGTWGQTTLANAADAATTLALANQLKVLRNVKTASSFWGCDEMTIAQNQNQTICLPLDLSCLLGPSQKKLLPLWLCNGLMLEITLDPFGVSSSAATPPQFQIFDVQYHAQCIDFDASVNQALRALSNDKGLFMHGVSWTNVLSQIPDNTQSWIISERLRSIKSVFFAFNDPSSVGTAWYRSNNRQTNNLTNYQVKIGSEYYPPQRIQASNHGDASNPNSNGEFVNELNKAIGEYANTYHESLLNIYNFSQDVNNRTTIAAVAAVAANPNANPPVAAVAAVPAGSAVVTTGLARDDIYQYAVGRALYGLDLDAFGRSDSESGVSSILNNPLTFNFQQNGSFGGVLNAYTMLMHDVVFQIDPSGLFTVAR